MTSAKIPPVVDWSKDPYWRNRRFSPAQLLIHDVRFTENPFHPDLASSPYYRIQECLNSTLLPDLENRDYLLKNFKPELYSTNREERRRFENYANNYGWLNCLRSKGIQKNVDDPPGYRRCRWIHISSKDVEYSSGLKFFRR